MRTYCKNCNKVLDACYCEKIHKFENQIKLIILQHPSETNHALNSARIAHLSFLNSELFIGEDFSQHEKLNHILKTNTCYLLFPGNGNQKVESISFEENMALIVIDGTWKKAKKIFFSSTNLHQINQIEFSNHYESRYKIRKEPKKSYLSTLEAVTFALEHIEQKNYSEVFEAFDFMITYQIEKMGLNIYQQNYLEKK